MAWEQAVDFRELGIWSAGKNRGTGGLLIIYADAINSESGKILARGSYGNYDSYYGLSGGSSGGGSINVFYKSQINKEIINAGNGCVTTGNISTGKFISD